jgi:hypothetical protein
MTFDPADDTGEERIIELTLLLSRRQAELLEQEARRRGQTVAAVLRGIVREFFERQECPDARFATRGDG